MQIRRKLEEWATLSLEEQERFCAPPTEIFEDDDGMMLLRYFGSDEWLHVGYIPMPKTKLARFLYHLVHGLAMRYPLHKVLVFALTNMEYTNV